MSLHGPFLFCAFREFPKGHSWWSCPLSGATASAISSGAGDVGASRGFSFHHQQSAFQNSPSLTESAEEISSMRYREQIAGNIISRDARNIPAFEITQGDWLRLSSNAFREHAGDRPGASKALAAILECSDKTTKSWLAGETAPSGILDLRAMSRIPAYAALKRKLAAQESALDPRVQQTIQELHRMTMQLAGEEV